MSHWLDDAAQGLSEGRYSRRHILRRGAAIAGGAFVASVTGPLTLLTPAARANIGPLEDCKTLCSDIFDKCCDGLHVFAPSPYAPGEVGTHCCSGPKDCCIYGCYEPRHEQCCGSGQVCEKNEHCCGIGDASEHCCKDKRQCCGITSKLKRCCKKGEWCVGSGQDQRCCPEPKTLCGTGADATCCDSLSCFDGICCPGSIFGAHEATVCNGQCCAAGGTCCAQTLCCVEGESCCQDASGNPTCCSSTCCSSGNFCCTAGQSCCDSGCCDDACCEDGQGGSACCTDGTTCTLDYGEPGTPSAVYKCL